MVSPQPPYSGAWSDDEDGSIREVGWRGRNRSHGATEGAVRESVLVCG
ncbi:MAG: hypothetical protein AVDCRST_MAG18-3737 [uncultured Thermomicrobiales bacterium]|uniref:Uncharacterized protein n=1 Tax=uncultured Thermomicrobiales bacterium TaxID=1645740 RepID=A0A6J4VUF5_9BACT|nr:MAG: hypothetical protein AVDCRST_MAG18-3737 [uncultured Thermomicrobiales bacterium]